MVEKDKYWKPGNVTNPYMSIPDWLPIGWDRMERKRINPENPAFFLDWLPIGWDRMERKRINPENPAFFLD